MNTLFKTETIFLDLEGGSHASQDLAIGATICYLLTGNTKDTDHLYSIIEKYHLLDAIHEQMMKGGFPIIGTSEVAPDRTKEQLPAPAEEVDIYPASVTLEEAYKSLQLICGAKSYGWLRDLDGSKQNASDVRARVLTDYALNAHEDIDHLSTVLTFIAESIKVAEPTAQDEANYAYAMADQLEPVTVEVIPTRRYTLRQLMDRLNRDGSEMSIETLKKNLCEHNEKYRKPLVLGKVYNDEYILDHHEYEFLCELYSLKSESHYDGYGNARTLFGLWESHKNRGGFHTSFLEVVQAFKAHFNYVPCTYDANTTQIRSWFYNQFGN